jgi:hypothetical protein
MYFKFLSKVNKKKSNTKQIIFYIFAITELLLLPVEQLKSLFFNKHPFHTPKFEQGK